MKVLSNADDVIKVLSRDGALSPAQIAERIGVPRSSIYRLVDGLHAIGLTVWLPDGTAALSLRWLHLADQARASMSEWRGARQILTELVDATGQTAYLSVLRNNEAVCVEWVQGRGIGILILQPGRALPLHAGAAGRTLLAFSADVEKYLATSERTQRTPKTLVDADDLREDARVSRERGYVISDQDVTSEIAAIGAPVITPSGSVLGAVSVSGLADDILASRERYAKHLREATARLGVTAEPKP